MSAELLLGYIFSGFVAIVAVVYAIDRFIVYKRLSDKLKRSEVRRNMAEANRDLWEAEAKRCYEKWQKEKTRRAANTTSQKV